MFVNVGLGSVEKYHTFVLVQFTYLFVIFSILLTYLSLECVFFTFLPYNWVVRT